VCPFDKITPFDEITGLTVTLLEKDPHDLNSEESSENRETFSSSKFDPATGVTRRLRKESFPKVSFLLDLVKLRNDSGDDL